MSEPEIACIREDIAELRAIVEERGKTSANHASLLRIGVGAVLIQIVTSVYFAGQKTQLLDSLHDEVITLQDQVAAIKHGNPS